MEQDEILDLVDLNDQVIQSMPRSQVYEQNLCSQMRSVTLIIKNKQGQLWIPRRSFHRKYLPGYLDGSVMGHVKSGETYEQALIRETMEEVGFDVRSIAYKQLGKITPHQDKAFCFSMVYECQLDEAPINWNQDEFCEWLWLTPEQLVQKINQGEKIKDILSVIMQRFYL